MMMLRLLKMQSVNNVLHSHANISNHGRSDGSSATANHIVKVACGKPKMLCFRLRKFDVPAVFFFPFVQTVFEHCVIYNVYTWNPCRPSLKDLVASSGNRAFCKQCLCLIPVVFCALVKMGLVLSCFLTWIWTSAPVRFRLCFFQTKASFICSLYVEYFHLENWELRTLSYGRPVWELN